MNLNKLSAIALVIGAATIGTAAHAGGFLADVFIKPWNPALAKAADDAHRAIGSPLNQVPAAVGNMIAPGLGTAGQAAWEAQRSLRREMNRQRHQVTNSEPPMHRGRGHGTEMGNFCRTQAGDFGPGPFNPVGSPCFVNGTMLQGYVVR